MESEWKYFRKRKIPILTPCLYYWKFYTKKTTGVDITCVQMLDKGWNIEVVRKKEDQAIAEFLMKKVQKNRDFLKKSIIQSDKLAGEFLSFCRTKLSESNLKSCSNRELERLLKKYYRYYGEFSVVNVIPWFFLPDRLHEIIISKLGRHAKKELHDAYAALSTPNELTYTGMEELEKLRLALHIKEKKIKDFESRKDFKDFVRKYFWIPFDYTGPKINDEKAYAEIIRRELLLKTEVLKGKIRTIVDSQASLRRKQNTLAKRLRLSGEMMHLFEAMKCLAILQDSKKAITTESHYYLQNLFKEIAARAGIDFMDMYCMLDDEIIDVLLRKKDMKKVMKDRKDLAIGITYKGKVSLIEGKKAAAYMRKNKIRRISESDESDREVTELKGAIGSPGKTTGTVQVIINQQKMHTFKKGNILVTTMTTPDFVPIMTKAKAIITNEGGATSHAAIVSRELRIPCIIGTGNATSALKDGDLVEVDADKGTVRIIKRRLP